MIKKLGKIMLAVIIIVGLISFGIQGTEGGKGIIYDFLRDINLVKPNGNSDPGKDTLIIKNFKSYAKDRSAVLRIPEKSYGQKGGIPLLSSYQEFKIPIKFRLQTKDVLPEWAKGKDEFLINLSVDLANRERYEEVKFKCENGVCRGTTSKVDKQNFKNNKVVDIEFLNYNNNDKGIREDVTGALSLKLRPKFLVTPVENIEGLNYQTGFGKVEGHSNNGDDKYENNVYAVADKTGTLKGGDKKKWRLWFKMPPTGAETAEIKLKKTKFIVNPARLWTGTKTATVEGKCHKVRNGFLACPFQLEEGSKIELKSTKAKKYKLTEIRLGGEQFNSGQNLKIGRAVNESKFKSEFGKRTYCNKDFAKKNSQIFFFEKKEKKHIFSALCKRKD